MNMDKLCDKLTSKEDLRDIPLIYIFRVAFAVLEIINSGECFHNYEGDLYELDIV